MAQLNRRSFGLIGFGAFGAVFLPHSNAVAGSFALARVAIGRCSFCRRSVGETKAMVSAGPVRICTECIALCVELIQEEDRPREERPKSKSVDTEELRGLTRAQISERIAAAGCACAVGTPQHEECLDWLEMQLRWDWSEALKDDFKTLMTTKHSREEVEALLVARGWIGDREDPTFQRLVTSLHRLSGKEVDRALQDHDEPPPPPPGTPKGTIYCSFCGSLQPDVRKLIAGPSVYICDRCANDASKLV